jgi:hypothetical protein
MVLFRTNDPFSWGTVGTSMLNILRLESGDGWDYVFYPSFYGCDKFPDAYPFLKPSYALQCTDPKAGGWLAVFWIFFIIIIGQFTMPTVLIGIVANSFSEASDRALRFKAMVANMKDVVERSADNHQGFFTQQRLLSIEKAFDYVIQSARCSCSAG